MGFTQRAAGDLLYHTASCLEGQGAPAHGFSTRTGGVSQGCLSTLNLVGHNGARGKVNVPLTDEEIGKLRKSAETLKSVIANLSI